MDTHEMYHALDAKVISHIIQFSLIQVYMVKGCCNLVSSLHGQ